MVNQPAQPKARPTRNVAYLKYGKIWNIQSRLKQNMVKQKIDSYFQLISNWIWVLKKFKIDHIVLKFSIFENCAKQR